MQIEPVYGPAPLKLTCTGDGASRLARAHGRYMDAVLRGRVYIAGQTTSTLMPAGLSASPTTTTLWNPYGSNVYGVIWYASVTAKVAWVAAAAVWIAENQGLSTTAATTGTAGLVTNALTGAVSQGVIQPLTTATIAAAPTNLVFSLGIGMTGALTTMPQGTPIGDWINGAVILAPGNTLSFQSSTASPATSCTGLWIYEEVPINM